jgi:hypothetical protein
MKFKFLLYFSVGFLVMIISGGVLPGRASAALSSDISIDVAPENPAPNENATITLSSYAYNLDSFLISWSVDGKKESSGVGQKSFSTITPALGKETNVTATISLPDGDMTEVAVIKPSVLVLLWQANDSYVPPFYKGKAMPSPGSDIKIVALPEIKNGESFVDPNNMTYSWQQDYTNNPDGSGYGKNYFIYTNSYLDNSNDVEVTAQTLDQEFSTSGSINVATTEPKIEFYKNDANLGTIWEQALLDGHQVQGSEVIQAAPYFISPGDIRIPFLTFNWSINGEPVTVPAYSNNLLPIKAAAGTSGSSTIKLEVDNSMSITESASKEISVQF